MLCSTASYRANKKYYGKYWTQTAMPIFCANNTLILLLINSFPSVLKSGAQRGAIFFSISIPNAMKKSIPCGSRRWTNPEQKESEQYSVAWPVSGNFKATTTSVFWKQCGRFEALLYLRFLFTPNLWKHAHPLAKNICIKNVMLNRVRYFPFHRSAQNKGSSPLVRYL